MKDERIEIRTDKQTKDRLEKLAEKSNRTSSEYLNLLIQYAHKNNIKL
jgi:predicted DNA-binding protein